MVDGIAANTSDYDHTTTGCVDVDYLNGASLMPCAACGEGGMLVVSRFTPFTLFARSLGWKAFLES